MAEEIELKLTLSPKQARNLPRHPLLAGQKPLRQRLANTYYDTPDGSLERERIALRIRRAGRLRLQTVKTASPSAGGFSRRNEWETPIKAEQFDFSGIDDPGLRERLNAALPQLVARYATDFTRCTWNIQPAPSNDIELAFDRGAIEAGGRRQPICEVELESKRGDPLALFDLALRLQQDLRLHPFSASKAERAAALLAGHHNRFRKAGPLTLEQTAPPSAAFRTIALDCLAHLQDNEALWQDGDGTEALHQMHVALRRLRSALRLFEPVLDPAFLSAQEKASRALNQALGTARNWDILIERVLPHFDAGEGRKNDHTLTERCQRKRQQARKAVATILHSTEYGRFTLGLAAILYNGQHQAHREAQPASLKTFSAIRLEALAIAAGAGMEKLAGLDAEQRHRLRIVCKELRYGSEFFASLYPPVRVRSFLSALEHVQETLGHLNDLAVSHRMMARLGLARRFDKNVWITAQQEKWQIQLAAAASQFLATPAPWRRTNRKKPAAA